MQRTDQEAARKLAEQEAESEALARELQAYEAGGGSTAQAEELSIAEGSEALLRRLQEEEDAELARQMQQQEGQAQLPAARWPASAPSAAPGGGTVAAAHHDEAATIRRHLFAPSLRLTGVDGAPGGGSGCSGGAAASVQTGLSYARAAAEWPREVHARTPAPPIALPLPRPRGGGGAPELKRVQLVVDGANVGWNYGQANGLGYFSAAGVVCTSRPNP